MGILPLGESRQPQEPSAPADRRNDHETFTDWLRISSVHAQNLWSLWQGMTAKLQPHLATQSQKACSKTCEPWYWGSMPV